MLWSEQTWPDLSELAKENYLVVQPCGSIEQHGRHLPVDTDSRIISEIAHRAAKEVDRVLVLPCLSYGLSRHHMDFAGTISYSLETYISVCKDIAYSLTRHGFKTLILLNGHGGNRAALKAVSSAFFDEIDIRIMAVTYWELIDPETIAKIRTSPIGGMGHSGEFETSIILSLSQELVQTENYEANPFKVKLPHTKKDMFEEGCISFPKKFNKITKSGVLGDPTDSTPEKGRAFLDLGVAALADLLRRIQQEQK
jgi:creatinine amidohydrolase